MSHSAHSTAEGQGTGRRLAGLLGHHLRRLLLGSRTTPPVYKVCADVMYLCVKAANAEGECAAVAVIPNKSPSTSALSRLCPLCKGM